MYSFGFVEGLTWLVLVICGLIGFLYSSERVLAILPFYGDTKDKSSKMLKYLDIIMGVVAALWLTLLIADESAQFRWVTVLAFVLFMVVSFAHPAKDLEGWSLILLAIPFVFVTIIAFWLKSDRKFNVAGSSIPLWLILGIVALVMLILFLVVFFVEETIVDPILYFLGWAPVVVVVSIFIIVQGVLMVLFTPHIDGILHFV